MVRVELLDPRLLADSNALTPALALLHPDERVLADRFVFPEDRHAFIAARALARRMLARQAGVPAREIAFAANEYGKPHVDSPAAARGLTFNISHTRELVACVVSSGCDVGIDVEVVRDPPLELADHYFAPPEVAALHALDASGQRDAFFALWTLKESFIKALGLGLSMPLDRFAVRWSPPALLPYGDFVDTAADWQFTQSSPTDTCQLAVCVHAPTPPPIEVAWASGDG